MLLCVAANLVIPRFEVGFARSTARAADIEVQAAKPEAVWMRADLAGVAGSQGDVFTRAQAIAAGITSREFATMTKPGGPWVKVRYAVYADRGRWQRLDDDGRAGLRDLGALLVCHDDAVLSHSSAARRLGLPLVDVDDGLSHLTRASLRQTARVEAGIKHHVAALSPEHVSEVLGIPVTTPIRTVLDVSREYGYRAGLVAADAALRAGANREDLINLAEALTTEPYRPVFAAVAAEADGRAETPIETLGRILVKSMGITELELQHRFTFDDGGYADGDIYSPELDYLFECDGRMKYQDGYDDFGRLVTGRELLWKEKKREDKVRGLGTGVSRIIWVDTLPHNGNRARQRLWREIEQQRSPRRHRSA